MSTLDDRYPLEIMERCLKWANADEGKVFWRWLERETRLAADVEGFVGAWEMEKIVQANKMVASRDQSQFIYGFREMLQSLINEKKVAGQDFVVLDEIE